MLTQTIDQTRRNELTGQQCTLDGQPATIRGRLRPFPTVATLDGYFEVVYSWETVNRVMSQLGGKFRK